MSSNVRVTHKRKASSINRSFVGGFPLRRVLFSDGSNPALMVSAPPVVATCAHPFSAMRITNWMVSTSGRTLRLDAFCEACHVRYSKEVSTADDEQKTGL